MSATTNKAASSASKAQKAALLDDEGDLTPKFEAALIRVFARFSASYKKRHPDVHASESKSSASLPRPDAADVLTEADLDAFSTVTNGATLPQESKNEIREFLDTDEEGNLTLRGFIEMYHLQSDNEPEETWKDLGKLGFDDSLGYNGEQAEQPETKEAEASISKEAAESRDKLYQGDD
ncbi:hypothetical protein EX895_000474 [Sporisorium graminicola]|uniref:EF-hand domain-containing protein n=1 Tax=Sporisorium graminicola TaxID=280036 RepID=A0A4U7L191_9BASI|nr:hypothetical protein EX895_000474 [Sporisorium graminicola]TKY90476.1 hypothetical protein EX895_000474 [Sporisorium graminicola]